MPTYVTKALQKFQHPTPKRAQYAPHQWTRPNYGATKKLETPVEEQRSLGGSIISRLDNGAFVGLIYELLVFY